VMGLNIRLERPSPASHLRAAFRPSRARQKTNGGRFPNHGDAFQRVTHHRSPRVAGDHFTFNLSPEQRSRLVVQECAKLLCDPNAMVNEKRKPYWQNVTLNGRANC